MKKTRIAVLVAALLGTLPATTRVRTADVAFQFRMGAGFPGDVNRLHPASIEPTLVDANSPPTLYGQPVLVDPTTQGVRPFGAGDTAVTYAYGIIVRPFPIQGQTAAGAFGVDNLGTATPPTSGPVDVLRSGYAIVSVVGAPVKGGTVYIWCAASAAPHVQGGFEAVNPGGSGCALDSRFTFNGPADANGVTEISFNA